MARDLWFEGKGGVCLREKLSYLFFDGRNMGAFDDGGDWEARTVYASDVKEIRVASCV